MAFTEGSPHGLANGWSVRILPPPTSQNWDQWSEPLARFIAGIFIEYGIQQEVYVGN